MAQTDEQLKDLKKKIQENKAVLGKDEVLKGLRAAKFAQVFLTKNTPADLKQEIEHYASITQTPVAQLEMTNEELGIFARKNYFVAVLGVLKE